MPVVYKNLKHFRAKILKLKRKTVFFSSFCTRLIHFLNYHYLLLLDSIFLLLSIIGYPRLIILFTKIPSDLYSLSPFPSLCPHVFIRSENCEVFCNVPCSNCIEAERFFGKLKEETAKWSLQSLPSKAPLTISSKERLVVTVQKQDCLQGTGEPDSWPGERNCKEQYSCWWNIADNGDNEITPHMRVFWEQQRKLLATPKFGRRQSPCHPILPVHPSQITSSLSRIAWFWYFSSAKWKNSEGYRNFFKPRAGFHLENIERLSNQTSQYFDIQRYVVLSFDEIKIQSKLVFDKHSNELIGFVDLGEEELNMSSFGSSHLASHILEFFVRCCYWP